MQDRPLEKNSHSLQKYSEAKFKVINSSLGLNEAIALMKQDRSCCLLIESQLKLTGILTERDLVELIYSEKDLSLLDVEQVMTQNPISLNVDTNLSSAEVFGLFQRHNIGHLPLVNSVGKGVGVITPSSILDNLASLEIANAKDFLEDGSVQATKQLAVEKIAEQRQNHNFLKTVLEQMPGGVIIVEASSGKHLFANDNLVEIFRREIAQFNNLEDYNYFGFIVDDDRPSPGGKCPLVRALQNNPVQGEEMRSLCGDEEIKTLLVNSAPIYNPQGKIIAAIATFYDISNTKQARLTKQEGANKSIFLKEIHHQIKNNLQVVSALLDLQSEQLQDKAAYLLLEKSQARIQTMALIYEQLYSSSNIEKIDFAEYVTSLSQYLYDSFIEDYKQIELILNIESIELDIDLATPCGLIINELVTNSLQHGFRNQNRGKIQIDFFLDKNNQYNVQIIDNGSGINPNISIQNNSEFLGLSIVKSLITDQLKGTWNIFSRNGCVIQITFPKKI